MAPGVANLAGGATNHSARTGRVGEPNASSSRLYEDDTRLSHGTSLGQGFGGTSSWNGGIWGNLPMSTGFASVNTENSRPRDGQSYATPGIGSGFEGKAGSGSLVASSESEGWGTRQRMPWNSSDSTSPILSCALLKETGLLSTRHRNSNQNAPPQGFNDHSRSISPYYQVARPSAIGQGLNKSPRKTYLDPTSGSFVTGQRLDGRPNNLAGFQGFDWDEKGQEHPSAIPGSLDSEGIPNARNDRFGFTNSSSFQATGGGVASRSQSIPPSRNGTDQLAPYDGPGGGSFLCPPLPQSTVHDSVHRHTQSGHSSTLSSQTNNRAYEELTYEAQERGMLGDLNSLSLDGITRQRSNNEFGGTNITQYSTQSPYGPGFSNGSGNMRVPAEKRSLSRHESFTPEGLPDGPFTEQLQGYRGSTLAERGSMSPRGNDYSRSQQSSYYSTGGTPVPKTSHYFTSSRGMPNHRAPPNGHSALLDTKLRGLQQEQQGFHHPQANLYMNQNFRGHYGNPYDYPYHNGLALNSLAPYYPLPPGIPPVASILPPKGPARDQDVGHGLRSALLEDFRSNSKTSKRYDLKDIYNHVVEFSGDQHGSRFIQQKLETANSDEKDQIFREIQPNAMQLMTDVFGNYVIQKFFEHGNQSQKKILANVMKGRILSLSTQMYGCRVVQKALEHVLTDQQAAIVKELENHVLKCVKDQNGNHVIQKAIERVPAEHIQFIINAFTGQVHSLATHPYGCRVIQRMLEHCQEPSRSSLLQELHACGPALITDQYGNYVTQHVIEHGQGDDRAKIIKLVTVQVVLYSKHKFASNVVEKSIQFGTSDQRRGIMETMITGSDKGDSPIQALARDQFGNYVIQKLLVQLKGADHDKFMEHLQQQLALLKKYTYGKQITAIEKVMYSSSAPVNNPHSVIPPISSIAVDTSAATTPPPLTSDAQSPQSSSLPSTNTSTVDGPTTDCEKTEVIGPVDIATAATT
ncbi:MAG: mRNA binding protein puf3 [Candelina mexicana]|nr:MAG: mRNA binding protein puf3 [Candelina mexicana]